MSDLKLRTILTFELDDESNWFADKKLVGTLIDAVLATDLASAITHAGVMGKERPVKGSEAIRKAMITGKAGVFTALDAPQYHTAKMIISFDVEPDNFEMTMMIGGPILASRTKTLLDSIESIARAHVEAMRKLGGLVLGFTHPMSDGGFDYPRIRPPISHRRIAVAAILDFIDLKFHRGDHHRAHPEDFEPMATAKIPAPVRRSEHDGLVILRWIDSLEDERALAVAAGRHAQWLAGILQVERSAGFNEQGDQLVELSERTTKAPFTMYDPEEGIGYKALVVDPRGEPDAEVWDKMVKTLVAKKNGLQNIRLIVPLRKLAIAIGDRARKAGFDAVLYPDDENRFWNPQPDVWWIEDEPGEDPPTHKRA